MTRGKGPFADRPPSDGPGFRETRWVVPPVILDAEKITEFLEWTQQRSSPAHRFFQSLADMTPAARLARNMSEIARCLARQLVVDVLSGGLSDAENRHLAEMERIGIPVLSLGVAHALLNLRERQWFIAHMGELFSAARYTRKELE